MKTKVFGIGLQRTGTTSLYQAFRILGCNAAPHGIPLLDSLDHPLLKNYDAFCDNPIPLIYRQLDEKIPGSKFILTTRIKADWLKSVQWLFEQELQKLNPGLRQVADRIHQAFYGTVLFDQEVFSKRWDDFHQEVKTYFRNREHDLLVLHLEEKEKWKLLCGFLHKKIPRPMFPHDNKRTG